MSNNIAVTGGSGFVGSTLIDELRLQGFKVVSIARDQLARPPLRGVDTIIHCAGMAHSRERTEDAAEKFDAANHRLSAALARSAIAAGVRRFVFVSSINVVSGHKGVLRPEMPYAPTSDFGVSKANAERVLMQISGIDVVIARPALVYGPGAPGNLRALMRICSKSIPLPFGDNSRSLVSISNLVSALIFVATAEASKVSSQVFHVADRPVSTAELVAWARRGMGKKPGLVPLLAGVTRLALHAIGRGTLAEQLYGDMLVDYSDLLSAGWRPQDDQIEAVEAMGRAYLAEGS